MGECVVMHVSICVRLHGGCLGDVGVESVHEYLIRMGCLFVRVLVCVSMRLGWEGYAMGVPGPIFSPSRFWLQELPRGSQPRDSGSTGLPGALGGFQLPL